MDLNHVTTFVRVVGEGSFTAAAKSLGVPKSSVSRGVSQLEHDLGVRLLHRTTRQLALTDAGAVYFERVSRALGDIVEATSATSDMQGALAGPVRVTAPVDFGVYVLASLVARFVRKYPRIHVDLVLTGRIVDLVGEGVDFAIRAGALRDSSLVVRRIGPLESGLYATPRYLARRGLPKTLEDLADHDVVLFRATAGRATLSLEDTRVPGVPKAVAVTGKVTCDDLGFLRKAVLAHAGIALLPRFLCAREEASGKLVRVLGDLGARAGVLQVVYPSARFVPERVKLFREFVLDALTSLPRIGAG